MANLLIGAGILLCFMLKLDILGHDTPQSFWYALQISSAVWLLVALFYVRQRYLLLLPIGLMGYLFPFHFSTIEPAGLPKESQLVAYLKANNVVGAAVAVSIKNQHQFAGYGRVTKFGEKPTADTQYQIASVTKAFTGTVLANANKPSLIPYATHTSGLPDITDGESFPGTFLFHPYDFYAHYNEAHINNDIAALGELTPGKWQYSNLAFCKLGLLLNIQEQDFGEISFKRPKHLAGAYNPAGVATNHWVPGDCAGAGGLHASTRALTDFARQPSDAKKVYFDDGEHVMGLGWNRKGNIWYITGATFGNTAFVAHDVENDITLVILTSGMARNIGDFGLGYLGAIIKPDC